LNITPLHLIEAQIEDGIINEINEINDGNKSPVNDSENSVIKQVVNLS